MTGGNVSVTVQFGSSTIINCGTAFLVLLLLLGKLFDESLQPSSSSAAACVVVVATRIVIKW